MEYAALIMLFASVMATDEFRKYLSNQELAYFLKEVNDNYQNISHLYSIGTSVLGEDIWVLMLSLAPANEIGVPNVKIVGNIHGNEPVGRELVTSTISMLLAGYMDNNEDIIHLLKTTKIHFLPSANPDGFAAAVEGECDVGPGRRNYNNVDLNRDFIPVFDLDDKNLFTPRESETQAIMQWMLEIHFVLSISIHAGSLVVVYPYDESKPGANPHEESLTDDNDIFKHLALIYAVNTKGAMYEQCPNGRNFENGIINGASWYSVKGTMGDFNYYYQGCMELTIEVSCCKYPHPSKLHDISDNHVHALLNVMKEVHQGVKGIVTCGGIRALSYIQVVGRNMTIKTTDEGEYWRVLLPGRYFLEVESASCKTEIVLVEIPKRRVRRPKPVILNIHLEKKIWEGINDEIELGEIDYEETTMYYLWNTTESFGQNITTNKDIFQPPIMESSISGGTEAIISSRHCVMLLLCWILFREI